MSPQPFSLAPLLWLPPLFLYLSPLSYPLHTPPHLLPSSSPSRPQVQNLAKESLPRISTGNGDGMLRLQARGSYQNFEMLHPLLDWLPPAWRGGEDKSK